jgi:hypothetical protein
MTAVRLEQPVAPRAADRRRRRQGPAQSGQHGRGRAGHLSLDPRQSRTADPCAARKVVHRPAVLGPQLAKGSLI